VRKERDNRDSASEREIVCERDPSISGFSAALSNAQWRRSDFLGGGFFWVLAAFFLHYKKAPKSEKKLVGSILEFCLFHLWDFIRLLVPGWLSLFGCNCSFSGW
jgi:hypothetical protein